jgi:allophanate hydrolase subunit 2
MSFRVRRAGTYSLLVDAGRLHALHLGLPRSGPADVASWQLGNALVGNVNPDEMTALEVTLFGPELEATESHEVVVYGAPFAITVQRANFEKISIQSGHSFHLEAGDTLQINGLLGNHRLRAYVCIRGGLRAPVVMGSTSGLETITTATILEAPPGPHRLSRWVKLDPWPDAPPLHTVRLLPGTHLTKALRTSLTKTLLTVKPESNRMGLRLESSISLKSDAGELVSAPVTPGTLQLPSGGEPLLLGVDAQTIGGYPRLGHVITPDLDLIGQLRPGASLRIQFVDLDEAQRLAESHRQWLSQWVQRLQLAP